VQPLTARSVLRDWRKKEKGKGSNLCCPTSNRDNSTIRAERVAIEELLRRLITLIFAGRNRIIVIRRELPRTRDASWAKSLSHRILEDSPFRVLLDGDSLCPVHGLFPKVWWLSLLVDDYAAIGVRWPPLLSTLFPMAQMKPSNSRPTAVTIFCGFLPRAAKLR
jgi:hypothetical protein